MRLLIVLSIISILFASCKDDPIQEPVKIGENNLLISNEGNFGWGEGTLSLYNKETQEVQNEVYKAQNNEALGNVFQSISNIDGQYFLVVNNSNKIVITDSAFNKKDEVLGLTSPRFIYQVGAEKAYVTDLYAKAISVVNLASKQVIKKITFNGWSEKGVIANNEFWVTGVETEYVYIIDIDVDTIKDSVQCGFATESIVLDQNNHVWVLSKGDQSQNKSATLTEIEPSSRNVLERKEITGLPTNMVYYENGNQLFYIKNGIWSMEASTNQTPSMWLASNNNNYYNITVDQESGEVYVSDIHDFVQKSTISRFSTNGMLLNDFKAGIIAGNFFFSKK
jgi:hypothetical protein